MINAQSLWSSLARARDEETPQSIGPPILDSLVLPQPDPAARYLHGLPSNESSAISSIAEQLRVPPHPTPTVRPPLVSPLKTRNIADPFADLLKPLSRQRRRGLIAQLSIGFYDGWRPSREEIADLVDGELGTLTVDEQLERQRRRTRERLARAARAAQRMRVLDPPAPMA